MQLAGNSPATNLAALAAALVGAAACSSGGITITGSHAPASVAVTPAAESLAAGTTRQLTAVVHDSSGQVLTGAPPSWSSSDTMVATVAGGVVTGWSVGSATITAMSDTASGRAAITVGPTAAIPVEAGTTVGKDTLSAGDTPQGGQGQTIDGITCPTSMSVNYHVHAQLTLIVNGEQIAIPLGIGAPGFVVDTAIHFVDGATCFYSLHTHDEAGLVHVEATSPGNFTLGQFFDIWGEPLSDSAAAGFAGPVTVYVAGALYRGDPRAIPLISHQLITLELGTPRVPPPTYTFPRTY